MAEERSAALEMLADARVRARREVREGREFLVLSLPDRYSRAGPSGGRKLTEDQVDVLLAAE